MGGLVGGMGWLGFGATFTSANLGGGLAGFLGMAPNCLSLFGNAGTFFESANVGGGLADITKFAAKPGLGGYISYLNQKRISIKSHILE